MNKKQIIRKTEEFVRIKMSGEATGHDWLHVDRVRRNALVIAKKEKQGDLFIIQLAALTHDLDDWKFRKTKLPVNSLKILSSVGLNKNDIQKVLDITENISFKRGTNKIKMKTIEGKIVQDADRLDAIGAIGIARVFAFGGKVGREIYNPEKKYGVLKKSKIVSNTSLNHFSEKLLLLKKRMNTKTGKKIAQERHAFMVQYLKQFYREWKGLK